MIVKDWMSKPVITASPEDGLDKAREMTAFYKIRCLPIVQNDQLVGIVTTGDIKRASASDATSLDVHELLYLIKQIKLKTIMKKDPVTIAFDATLDEAAAILMAHTISSLPVVAGGDELVGILTRTDLLKAFVSLTSYTGGGIQFGLIIDDHPGAISAEAGKVWQAGGRIATILSTTDRAPKGSRRLYIRAYQMDARQRKMLKDNMLKNEGLYYYIDHTDNERKILRSKKQLSEKRQAS